ncbi:hypothetical protein CAS74_001308 [Pichia kudriavzevii]|uniref:Branchpoint-bridging protein n=1 Tax=Pichia kudriavzevii TaxID=4909 RepID=A0A1Z8JQX5_PICKU|nr:hypothetical protein CAS74_001308 [Pichia kudriavzevii]
MAMEETKLDLDVDFGDRGRTRERLFSSHHWTGKPSKGVAIRQHNKPTPTIISNTLTSEQIEAYATLVRIDEIGHMIATGVPVPVPTDGRSRSPSPEPIYDSNGLRKNTREQRMRQKLDRERNFLVERMFQLVEDYKAPDWYKPKPTKIVEKLYIKADEYPEINFVGLLLGPRGNTLNKLQKDSGAVIGIRGKGSVKQVNRGPSNIDMSHLQEKLHCLITADSQEKVDMAKKLCQEVMDKAIFSPVGQNDLKRDQLRELAKLNGTYRETSERMCPVCGNSGHGRNTCPQKPSFSSTLRCGKCGNIGHLEKDCISEGKEGDEMDQEFEEFMNDLNGNNEDPGVHQTSGNADSVGNESRMAEELRKGGSLKRSYSPSNHGTPPLKRQYNSNYTTNYASNNNNYNNNNYNNNNYNNNNYNNNNYNNNNYNNNNYSNNNYNNNNYNDSYNNNYSGQYQHNYNRQHNSQRNNQLINHYQGTGYKQDGYYQQYDSHPNLGYNKSYYEGNHDYSERHRGNNSYQPVQQLHGSQQLLPQPYTKPPVYPPSLKTTNRVPLPSTKAVDTTTRSHGVSVPTPPPPPPPPQAPQAPQSVPPQALPPPPPPPPPAKKAPGKKTTHPAQHLPPPPPPPPFRGKS